VLCRLGYLLGELPYLDAAERTLRAGWPMLQQYPQAHMSLANALEDFLSSMQILIVRGDAPQIEPWSANLSASYEPTRMIFAIPRDAADLPPALAAKRATAGTVAYVCKGMTCSAPLVDLSEIAREFTLRIEQVALTRSKF